MRENVIRHKENGIETFHVREQTSSKKALLTDECSLTRYVHVVLQVDTLLGLSRELVKEPEEL